MYRDERFSVPSFQFCVPAGDRLNLRYSLSSGLAEASVKRLPVTVVAGAIFGVLLAAFTDLGAVEGLLTGVVFGVALGLIGAFVTRLRMKAYGRME